MRIRFAAAPAADETDINPVIGADHATGGPGGTPGGERRVGSAERQTGGPNGFKKVPAIKRIVRHGVSLRI
jgi:hypothetical protein